mgnify:CR=1 FL=1
MRQLLFPRLCLINMRGKIIKGIAGFYYVQVQDKVYECKAKGIFRYKNEKPLVGDNVEIEVLNEQEATGTITRIEERNNSLIRPEVANIDQALIVFAAKSPAPNLNLLDRFLLMMQTQGIATVICFNKKDDADEKYLAELADNYRGCGSRIFMTSTFTGEGIKEFGECLKNKTSVLAGPSGVGKSSIINRLFPEAGMEIGEISEKIKRGKHTTRHSELFSLGDGIYIMDTPGFTSMNLPELEKEDLRFYFPEFEPLEGSCRFNGCVHMNEPDCAVKAAVSDGKIHKMRYESYTTMYQELKEQKKY